jgi:RHS repeat-associated protein
MGCPELTIYYYFRIEPENHIKGDFHDRSVDARGNVVAFIDNTGSTVAEYNYSPFGSMADEFTYKFSTKPMDAETGLSYYQYRYYSPELGRWLSRDPINQMGSMPWWADNAGRVRLHKVLKSTKRKIEKLQSLYARISNSDIGAQMFPMVHKTMKILEKRILFLQYEINLDLLGKRNNGNNDNPYAFVLNNPIDMYDVLGLFDEGWTIPPGGTPHTGAQSGPGATVIPQGPQPNSWWEPGLWIDTYWPGAWTGSDLHDDWVTITDPIYDNIPYTEGNSPWAPTNIPTMPICYCISLWGNTILSIQDIVSGVFGI